MWISVLVDARQVVLPNGHFLYVIVKEGMALLPNPELAKILPAVSRTAMEHIRNSYGISVEQVSVVRAVDGELKEGSG